MKKLFCCSDIHSFYHEWQDALKNAGYDKDNPNHVLVVCGDLMDRGEYPYECLKFINSIPASNKITIRGNHEVLATDLIKRGDAYSHDVSNGTYKTVCILGDYGGKAVMFEEACSLCNKNPEFRKYMDNLSNAAEIGPYIFVHGWYPFDVENWRTEATTKDWMSAAWENGMAINHSMRKRYPDLVEKDKTFVVGHFHCSYGHSHIAQKRPEFPPKNKKNWEKSFEIFEEPGIIAIDACTAYTGIVNIKVLEVTEEEYNNVKFY